MDDSSTKQAQPGPGCLGGAKGSEGPASLPCLSSNISTEHQGQFASNRLSVQVKKAATALAWNIKALALKHGLQHLGMLTLTFADHVVCVREAQRRFNSLATHILRSRYVEWVGVMERQKSGRIHYHLIVVQLEDIRSGFDWAGIEASDYRSASPALRSEWSFWRRTAKAYRFGRTELLPIRSTEEGIGRYLGKYLGKHYGARLPEDKGARLVRYSSGARMAVTRFNFVTPGAAQWRRKVRAFAWLMFQSQGIPPTMQGLRTALGPRWAYSWREFIMALPD